VNPLFFRAQLFPFLNGGWFLAFGPDLQHSHLHSKRSDHFFDLLVIDLSHPDFVVSINREAKQPAKIKRRLVRVAVSDGKNPTGFSHKLLKVKII